MLGATLVLLLAATPPQGIAVTPFRLVQVEKELGGYAEDRLAQQLTRRGFQVSTPADLETLLGLDRQRQLLGCNDNTSCFAELTGALGVPLVVTGRLTRLGKRLELDLRVISQRTSKVVVSDARGTDDEARLGSLIAEAADAVADQLLPKEPATPFRWRLWVPVALGVGAFAGAAALIGTAEGEYAAWTSPTATPGTLSNGQVSARFNALSLQRNLGFGLAGLGAALVIGGLVWNALTPDAPVVVSLRLGSQGAGFVLGGRF